MKPFPVLLLLVISCLATASMAAGPAFPDHWGDPPKIQTRDLRPLPGGYGRGSSTLAAWIQKNLDADREKKDAESKREGAEGGETGPGGVKLGPAKDLWNGRNLEDFEIKSGNATYEIDDGAILGTTSPGSPNTFLCTRKQYGDFELTFEVKCHDSLNSGVQIRSKVRAEGEKFGGRVNGPQVEIEAGGARGAESGYIYGEAAGGWLTPKERLKPHKRFKDGEWNRFRVLAVGPRIRTWINGEPIEDLTHEKIYATHPAGLIGLQVHGVGNAGPYTVAWRNLKIREVLK